MGQAAGGVDHKQLGIDLFNATWELLRREDRTTDEDAAMIHQAHASVHHWSRVGTEAHTARGEWQVSRVYATLGQAEPARWHAQRCLDVCQRAGLTDWDLAFAYEAMARACAVAGDSAEASRHVTAAEAVPIAAADDRDLLAADLATIRL